MKSSIFLAMLLWICNTTNIFAQNSTKSFEDESPGNTSFTDNGVIFNIISHKATFNINRFTGAGWNGTNNDNQFIDNNLTPQSNSSFSIKTTSNLFKVNRFWIFLSDISLNQNGVMGTLTITGKLSGVTKYNVTKTTGFNTTYNNNTGSPVTSNGYTLIDMTNINGSNYSNIVIDQLTITAGGSYTYMGLDAFTWAKDSNTVLSTNDVKNKTNAPKVYPNPTSGELNIFTDESTPAVLYDSTGRKVKNIDLKKGNNKNNISDLPPGQYLLQTTAGQSKIIKTQ